MSSTGKNIVKKRGLGKGLNALFGTNPIASTVTSSSDYRTVEMETGKSVILMSLDKIFPNPNQPRTEFDRGYLEELAESIMIHGVIQPILVQKMIDRNYQIVAGERRFRASQIAGKSEIPCIVIEGADDAKTIQLALIENIQRRDLSIIEEANAYQALINLNYTHEKIASSLGKNRSHITNAVRILRLPKSVLTMVEGGDLSFGHAKLLVGIENPLKFAEECVRNGLSVRQLEGAINSKSKPNGKTETNDIKEEKKCSNAFEFSTHYENDGSIMINIICKNQVTAKVITTQLERLAVIK